MKKILSLFVAFLTMIAVQSALAQSAEDLFQKGIQLEEVKGELEKAINVYKSIVEKNVANKPVMAKTLLHLGNCYEKLGKSEAKKAYERIVREFTDQGQVVTEARARLAALGNAANHKEKLAMTTRQVWANANSVGSISADGRYICYRDYSSNLNGDVAVRDLATGETRRLMKDENPFSLRISPDGKQIAYSRALTDDFSELRIMNIDGSEPRVLYRNEEVRSYDVTDWSSDGKYILTLFVGKGGGIRIALVPTSKDGSLHLLKTLTWNYPNKMSLSPDGRWIAYDLPPRTDVSQRDIYLLASDGSRETHLIEHPANDDNPIWTPDGKRILFSSDRRGTPGLWSITVADGKPQGSPELIKEDLKFYPVGMTSTGALYYSLRIEGNDVYTADIDSISGKLLSLPKLATERSLGSNTNPEWSPDGKYLAFLSPRNLRDLVVVQTVSTGEEREFHSLRRIGYELKWSPDGRSLLTSAYDSKGRRGIHKIDVQTDVGASLVPNVNTSNYGIISIGWFPHDNSIFYVTPEKENRLIRKNLDTGEEQELFKFTENSYYVAISPDGKQFACYQVDDKAKTRSILLVSASGGKPRELLKINNPFWPALGIAWTPDGKYLMFGRTSGPEKKIDLWRISVAGGDPEKLGSLMSGVHELSVHPDGKRIAFSVRQGKQELWVMENFLPKEEQGANNKLSIAVRKVGSAENRSYLSAISLDGRLASYFSSDNDLGVRDLENGTERVLVKNDSSGGNPAEPVFSPDGKSLAYTALTDGRFYDIFIVNIDNGNRRHLSKRNEEVRYFLPYNWSHDGKTIATILKRKDGTYQIALTNAADGSFRVLKTLDWRIPTRMYFSADDRHLAYDIPQGDTGYERDIYSLATDGSREVAVVKHPADDFLLGWSTDGRYIVFASDRTRSVGVWLQGVSDGHPYGTPESVKSDVGRISSMGITRNGSLYYNLSIQMADVNFATLDPSTGKVVVPPTPMSERFVGGNSAPDWSPDGKQIAFVTQPILEPTRALAYPQFITIRSLETGKERTLSPELGTLNNYNLRWSPDGRSLLIRNIDKKGRWNLNVIDALTGKVISSFGAFAFWSEWSKNGNAIYYMLSDTSTHPTTRPIRVHTLETGEEKILYSKSEVGFGLSLSPDGKQIAFSDFKPDLNAVNDNHWLAGLNIIPSGGGQARTLFTTKSPGGIGVVSWSADGKYLFFERKNSDNGKAELWRIAVSGGDPQDCGIELTPVSQISMHPDGRRIAFHGGKNKSETWVMENFLPKEEPEKSLTVRRVEDGNGQLISPDGRYRLVRDKSTGALAIQDLTTGENRRFRKDETIGWPSQISPDGKQIAYQAFDFFEGKTTGLNVISADGSEHRVLYRNEEIRTYSVDAWSPDGKYILTTFAGKGGVQIALVPTSKDGSVHILKTLPWAYPLKMSFSPDGRWIAYDLPPSSDVQQRDIFLLASDGSRETHLIENPANDGYPLWTRDGKRILFVSDRRGTSGLWSIAITDGKPQASPELLKPDVGQMNPVGITAEGTLYYQFGVNANDIYAAEIDSISGKLLSSPKLATERFLGFNSKPEWSPDGQYLTYVSRRGTTPTSATVVVIHSVKTGEDRELGSVLGIGFELKWSPDGHALLVSARDSKGRRGINKVDVRTGAATLVVANVTTMGGGFSSVGWFPQDKSIFYISPLRENRLIRTNLESGEEQDIFKFAKPTRYLTISPDGKQFACWRADSGAAGLVLLPAKGGNPRELFKIMEDNSSYLSGLAWTPDGQHLMFAKKSGSEEEIGLWRISVEGGEPQRLGSLMDGVDELSVHPDGKRIAFSVRQSKRELWTMENFLSRSLDSAR